MARSRKAYYVEELDVMTEERKTIAKEFRNKKYAISLLKDLENIGCRGKVFFLKERFVNC